MCFLCKIFKCKCEDKCENKKEGAECQCGCHKHGKKIVLVLAMILVAAIVIVSILRERIVSENQDQTTIFGQGRVAYVPNLATVILGIQVDKAISAEEALKQIDDKTNKIITAIKAEGISDGNIQTSNFSLNPQYDFTSGKSTAAGYSANQQLTIKVLGADKNKELVGKVISAANGAGANQIISVNFTVSNLNDLKQKARTIAIRDAISKSGILFKTAGMKDQKVTSWFENYVQSPDTPVYGNYGAGMGGSDAVSAKAAPSPQVPSGTQEIIIEIGVNYKAK